MASSTHAAEDRGLDIIVIDTIFPTLASLCVLGRFLSRKIKRVPWGLDDWTIVLALLMTWTIGALCILSVHLGVGRHIDTVPPDNVVSFMRNLYVINIIYVLLPPTIKVSILLLYKRIFAGRRFALWSWALLGIIVIWAFVMTVLGIVSCLPINGFWDRSVSAQCLDFRSYCIGYAALNISTDIAILFLPMPWIWKLKLPLSQKVALTLVFLLGTFACASSIIRLITSILVLNDVDVTWSFSNASYWTLIEPSSGIICACFLTMKPLVTAVIPSVFRSSTQRSSERDRSTWMTNSFSRSRMQKRTTSDTDTEMLDIPYLPPTGQFSGSADGLGLTDSGDARSTSTVTATAGWPSGGSPLDSPPLLPLTSNGIRVKREVVVNNSC